MSRRLSVQYKTQQKDKKAKPKVTFPDELIFLDSVKDNDVDEVRILLRRASANIDINKMNNSGLTPLHQACLENSFEVVKLLLECGADINCVDEEAWTPLHAAVSMGYCEIAEYLIQNGADPVALTTENERPIDLADPSDFPVISMLLNYMKSETQTYEEDDSGDEQDEGSTSSKKNSKTIESQDNNNANTDAVPKIPPVKKKSRFSIIASD